MSENSESKMILYSKVYDKNNFYEDFAKKHGIEIPKEVIKNVAYFNFDKNEIGYFGTSKIGQKRSSIIHTFYEQLKEII